MRQALWLAGILGGAIPMLAQSQSNPTPYSESVTVTASLQEVEETDLGVTLSVIERSEIEARQSTEVADLIATIPGVAVARSGSPGSVTSVFTRGGNSNQTLVLWNGLVLNDPFFGGFDWAHLGTESADKIEVVRGPLSTLYGSSALGGAIQVLTAHNAGARVRLEAGENSYGRGAVAAGHDIGSLHFDLVATYRTGDGEIENDFYDRQDLVARAEWRWQNGATLGLLTRLDDSELGIPRSGATLTPRRRQESVSRNFALPFNGPVADWQLQAMVSSTSMDLEFTDPDSFFARNDTTAERRRGRVVGTTSLGSAVDIGIGGDWQDDEVSNESTFGVNLDRDSQSSWASFGQLRFRWKTVSLEAAVRRDDHQTFGSEWSPGVAVVVDAGPATRVRASYGEAFRAPALGELFFPFSGNPDLQPETTESLELSVEHTLGPWRLVAAAFDNRQRDLIEFDLQTFTNVNLGRVRSRGAEASVRYQGGPWRAMGSFTYLDAANQTDDEELLRRPRESASLWLAYQPSDWTFSFTGRFVGERPDLDPVTFTRTQNPSYTRLDLAVRWQAFPWMSPEVRVENLGDKEYQEVLGFPAPGRSFFGGVTLRL
ncbi:MAG: TonB-dependent receptor [Deltaproteobacteria bacterium]|nr:TonB-dependent receptor [Deltaproteobacteria bacterium]